MADKHKILLYDIETAPLLAYIWSPSDDYVTYERLIHDSWVITWAAKWHGEKKVYSGVVTPTEAIDQEDTRIVSELADLIREADVVVAHNGDKFDLPMMNNRLLSLGLEPFGPVRTIDTLTLARKNFRLAYNKLDYLAHFLGLGRKIKTDFELWRQAYHGDVKALNQMSKYNIQDVHLLEKVFDTMRPYVKGLARLVDADYADEMACPSCGGHDLVRRGYHRTNASTLVKYRCNDCGRYCRERQAVKEHRLAVTPL